MLDEQLKELWKNAPEPERIRFDKAKVFMDLNANAIKMDKSIKYRNILEVGVAIVLFPYIASLIFTIPFLLSKVGAAIVCLGLLVIIYKLVSTRKGRPISSTTLSLRQQLEQIRAYYQQERA